MNWRVANRGYGTSIAKWFVHVEHGWVVKKYLSIHSANKVHSMSTPTDKYPLHGKSVKALQDSAQLGCAPNDFHWELKTHASDTFDHVLTYAHPDMRKLISNDST